MSKRATRKAEVSNHALAAKIAKELFANGFGQTAERLVLRANSLDTIGGWSREAAIRQIEEVLDKYRLTITRGRG